MATNCSIRGANRSSGLASRKSSSVIMPSRVRRWHDTEAPISPPVAGAEAGIWGDHPVVTAYTTGNLLLFDVEDAAGSLAVLSDET